MIEKLNRKNIFDNFKKEGLFDKYSPLQITSIDSILDEIEFQEVTDIRKQAYIFATAYHEAYDYSGKQTGTPQRLVPIQEGGSLSYLKSKKYYPYFGQGFVQLTWLDNYTKYNNIFKRLGKFTDLNIVKHPEQVKEPKVAAFIIVHGMLNGTFTGKKLSDYFNATIESPVTARMMINKMDQATKISQYYYKFKKALSVA